MRDLPTINSIINDAKQALKATGSPQWQDGHPTTETVINDITHHLSWVLVIDDQPVGIATIQPGPEKSCQTLTGGQWHNDDDHYLIIHRVAISSQYRGQHLSRFLFSNLLTIGQERGFYNFRFAAHRQNKIMQKVAAEFGFECRGTVQIDDQNDPERLVFELNLPTNHLPVKSHVDNDFMKPLTDKKHEQNK